MLFAVVCGKPEIWDYILYVAPAASLSCCSFRDGACNYSCSCFGWLPFALTLLATLGQRSVPALAVTLSLYPRSFMNPKPKITSPYFPLPWKTKSNKTFSKEITLHLLLSPSIYVCLYLRTSAVYVSSLTAEFAAATVVMQKQRPRKHDDYDKAGMSVLPLIPNVYFRNPSCAFCSMTRAGECRGLGQTDPFRQCHFHSCSSSVRRKPQQQLLQPTGIALL